MGQFEPSGALADPHAILARRQEVPPYVVFGDVTLRELAREKPGGQAALLDIRGIGEKKLRRYGSAFLAAISGESPEQAAEAAAVD